MAICLFIKIKKIKNSWELSLYYYMINLQI